MKKLLMAMGVGLAATLSVQAAQTGGTHEAHMQGMKMEEKAPPPAANRTRGVVKEFDAAKGTVTISHEAVPAIKWPAMTMAFKISPELARGVQVGQRVEFEFEAKGMAGTVTKITVIH